MTTGSADELRLRQLAAASQPPLIIEPDEQGSQLALETGLGFYHSFVTGPIERRSGQPGQLLLKACNNRQRSIASVLDLTAGWGVDAFTLARQGQRVCMLERNDLVQAIVAWSLRCLQSLPEWQNAGDRLETRSGSALDFLQRTDREFDCIYLDPMFPTHKSGAKPGKEMQLLQALTENEDIEPCFELALERARKRVVVKRAAKAPTLTGLKPDIAHRSKTVRFDVYLRH